ncbi:unnamed protein product [Amoebophrya sp. A25]|nr:unnamed protein product [Amoebophrya sp. A25]|eukprot:GSA25T00021383001.1
MPASIIATLLELFCPAILAAREGGGTSSNIRVKMVEGKTTMNPGDVHDACCDASCNSRQRSSTARLLTRTRTKGPWRRFGASPEEPERKSRFGACWMLLCLLLLAATTSLGQTREASLGPELDDDEKGILILDWHYLVKTGIAQVRQYAEKKRESKTKTDLDLLGSPKKGVAPGQWNGSADAQEVSVTLFMEDLYALRDLSPGMRRYFPDYCRRGAKADTVSNLTPKTRHFGNVSLEWVEEEQYWCPVENSVQGVLYGALRQAEWTEKRHALATDYRDFFSEYRVCVMYGGRQTAAVCLLNDLPTVFVPHLSLAQLQREEDMTFFLDEVLPNPKLHMVSTSYFDMALLDYLAGKENFVPYPIVHLARDELLANEDLRTAWQHFHGYKKKEDEEALTLMKTKSKIIDNNAGVEEGEISLQLEEENGYRSLLSGLSTSQKRKYVLFGGRKLPGAHGGSAGDPWLVEWISIEVGDWILALQGHLRSIYRARIASDRWALRRHGLNAEAIMFGSTGDEPLIIEQAQTSRNHVHHQHPELGLSSLSSKNEDLLCRTAAENLWQVIADPTRGMLASAAGTSYPWPEFNSLSSRMLRWIQKEAATLEDERDPASWEKLLVDKIGPPEAFRLCREYWEGLTVGWTAHLDDKHNSNSKALLSKKTEMKRTNHIEARSPDAHAEDVDADRRAAAPRPVYEVDVDVEEEDATHSDSLTASAVHTPIVVNSWPRHFAGGRYEWKDVLADVKALVIVPYSTAALFWHEAHALGIPLFAPSVALLWRWHLILQRVVLRRLERADFFAKQAKEAEERKAEQEPAAATTTTGIDGKKSTVGEKHMSHWARIDTSPQRGGGVEAKASEDMAAYSRSVMLNELFYSWHPSYVGNQKQEFGAQESILASRGLLWRSQEDKSEDPGDVEGQQLPEEIVENEPEEVTVHAGVDFLNGTAAENSRIDEEIDVTDAKEKEITVDDIEDPSGNLKKNDNLPPAALSAISAFEEQAEQWMFDSTTIGHFDVPFVDEKHGLFASETRQLRANPSSRCRRFCPKGAAYSPFRMFESKRAFFYWASKLDFYHFGPHIVRFDNVTDLARKVSDHRLLEWMRKTQERTVEKQNRISQRVFGAAIDHATSEMN